MPPVVGEKGRGLGATRDSDLAVGMSRIWGFHKIHQEGTYQDPGTPDTHQKAPHLHV